MEEEFAATSISDPKSIEVKGVKTQEGKYIQYNLLGNLFEVSAKYIPPIQPLGRGAYGIVCCSKKFETNEEVAIKKIGNAFDNRIDAKRTLREIKLLCHMDHENVVKIKDIIRPPKRDKFDDVYIVYELMDTDLYQIIRSTQALTEDHCQYFMYQLLRGLKYIHSARKLFQRVSPCLLQEQVQGSRLVLQWDVLVMKVLGGGYHYVMMLLLQQ